MLEHFSRYNYKLIGAVVVIAFVIINFYTFYKPRKNSLEMDTQDVFEFFNTDDGLDITWYNRANNVQRLEEALKDDKIKMIEADVIFGKLTPADKDLRPVMGHGKDDKIDLTVTDFVDSVRTQSKKKGIKLDFKDIEAVKPTLEYLDSKKEEIDFPVWLNADTVLGPGGLKQQVDGKKFIDLANNHFPGATLSLGFTYQSPSNTPLTQKMVKDMYELTSHSNSPVTFAINVAMFANSLSSVSWLLHQEPERFSLTLWTSMAGKNWEGASPEAICKVRSQLSKKVIFYDLAVHNDTWQKFLKLCKKV